MKRLLFLLTLTLACNRAETPAPPSAPPGDAARGKQLMTQYACNVCHIVPGIEGAQGRLGPALAGVASRPAISNGVVRNTPANLRQFIRNPASLNPQSSMPPIGMTEAEAQDITAFLWTLR